MGLLEKVVTGEAYPPLPTTEIIELLQGEKGLLNRGPIFFQEVSRRWQHKKACLLSLREGTYVPVVINGLDMTSGRRIRISKDHFDQWTREDSFILLREEKEWSTLLSLRESALVSSIAIIPMSWEDKRDFALLILIREEDQKQIISPDSLSFLKDEALMAMVYRSLNPYPSQKEDNIRTIDPNEMEKEIRTLGDEQVILKISLIRLLQKIYDFNAHKDNYILKADLLSLFRIFFNERVSLFERKDETLIISQPQELFPGKSLLERQLIISLGELYGDQIKGDEFTIEKHGGDNQDLGIFLKE